LFYDRVVIRMDMAPRKGDITLPKPGDGMRVALFATCINDILFPSTPKSVLTVLERLGCTVDFPTAQTCCGQMFTNTGYFKEGLTTVRTFLEAFEPYDYIVAPSASCVGSVRHQHPMLAQRAGDERLLARVEQIVPRTFDFVEFLVDVLQVTDVGAFFPHKVTYHSTCHSLRVTKVGDRPIRLLEAVKGLSLVPLPNDEAGLPTAEECCGFGGTFSLKNPDVSVAMASEKVRNILTTGAEYVVAGDNSCLMNIGGMLHRQEAPVKPIHLAEILAQVEEGEEA
jgi:L-lactate dehydrogenase complex protein LldE